MMQESWDCFLKREFGMEKTPRNNEPKLNQIDVMTFNAKGIIIIYHNGSIQTIPHGLFRL